jgi:hypothetical protein
VAELIHEYTSRFQDEKGTTYAVRACGEARADGTWGGWLEFHPASGRGPVLKTDQETSQPSRVTLEYWASGLEPIYFDGAFARAMGRLP